MSTYVNRQSFGAIRVTVPESTTVEQNTFVLLDGWFGMALDKVVTGVGETKPVTLLFDPTVEFETTQTDEVDVRIGDLLYWNEATKKFTKTSLGNRLVAKATADQGSDGVLSLKLLGQELPISAS